MIKVTFSGDKIYRSTLMSYVTLQKNNITALRYYLTHKKQKDAVNGEKEKYRKMAAFRCPVQPALPITDTDTSFQALDPIERGPKSCQLFSNGKQCADLDIGSGVGKFCLSTALFEPSAFYFGVEQRKNLVDYAETAREQLQADNVRFIHGNFTQLDLGEYDHIYFFNSFYENINSAGRIDDSIDYSSGLYHYYHRYLYRLLDKRPAGTRLATFHSLEDDLPTGYHLVGSYMDHLLKFWIKI